MKRRRKGKKKAERARRRVADIVSGTAVADVTVRWVNGVTKTFHLPSMREEPSGAVENNKVWLLHLHCMHLCQANRRQKTESASSPLVIPETQHDSLAARRPAPRNESPPPPVEIANSQASEDSFHDSQEYPRLTGREAAMFATSMPTTPKPRWAGSDSPMNGHSPELSHGLRHDVTENGEAQVHSSSPPLPAQSSPRLPELLPATMLDDSYSSPRPKRSYDPYALIPTPPSKRILRSSGKQFATPPWKTTPKRKPGPASDPAPVRPKSGLLRGKPVVSEAELRSIFSNPDPEFDRFDGLTSEATNMDRKDDKNAPQQKIATPLSRAVRGSKEDDGGLSDDTSYTGVMSTPLRNYGSTTHGTPSRRRQSLRTTQKRNPSKANTGSRVRAGSSNPSRSSFSKSVASRISQLPTSSSLDSIMRSSPSRASTKATTPGAGGDFEFEKPAKVVSKPHGGSKTFATPSPSKQQATELSSGTSPFASSAMPSAVSRVDAQRQSPTKGILNSSAMKSSSECDAPALAPVQSSPVAQIEISLPSVDRRAVQDYVSPPPEATETKTRVKKEGAEDAAVGKPKDALALDERADRKRRRAEKRARKAAREAMKLKEEGAEDRILEARKEGVPVEEVAQKPAGIEMLMEEERAEDQTSMKTTGREIPNGGGAVASEKREGETPDERVERKRRKAERKAKRAAERAAAEARVAQEAADEARAAKKAAEKKWEPVRGWVSPSKRTPVPLPDYVLKMRRLQGKS